MIGTLFIEVVDAYVLFDIRSMHFFLSPSLAGRLGVELRRLEASLLVSSPLGHS